MAAPTGHWWRQTLLFDMDYSNTSVMSTFQEEGSKENHKRTKVGWKLEILWFVSNMFCLPQCAVLFHLYCLWCPMIYDARDLSLQVWVVCSWTGYILIWLALKLHLQLIFLILRISSLLLSFIFFPSYHSLKFLCYSVLFSLLCFLLFLQNLHNMGDQ